MDALGVAGRRSAMDQKQTLIGPVRVRRRHLRRDPCEQYAPAYGDADID